MAVNKRQKLFVEEYLKDLNGTQGTIRAGYSPRTAVAQASRLLRNVHVSNAIKELREEIQSENIATIKDIEEFLSQSMLGNIEEEVVVTLGEGEGFSSVKKVKKQISAKDRIRAAELMGKRYGLFKDKVDLDKGIEIEIVRADDEGSEEG